MARLVRFQPYQHIDHAPDPLDKLIVVLTLLIVWRLLGGC